MTKLSTLFAIVAMTATLGAAGCKTKKTETQETAAKPTETATPEEKKPEETTPAVKPEEKKPEAATPAAATGELPAECAEYKASIEKLASCDKLPQATRDALKQAFDQAAGAWASVPAEGKAAQGTACKTAVEAVKQAAATTCGW